MQLRRKLRSSLLISCLSLACSSFANTDSDEVTIVSFSRHTFRGITEEIGPQKIALKEYGVELKVPLLGYAEDATPRGLEIAKNFAPQGLQNLAVLAVNTLDEDKKFDGRWDEFRTDLATERTFWTAVKVREGFNTPITLTGCKTTPGKAVDIVSTRQVVMQCMPSPASNTALLALFQRRTEKFLTEFRTASGFKTTMPSLPAPHDVDGKLELPKEYKEAAKLASAIEMVAALNAPLPQLVKKVDQVKHGKAVWAAGLNMLGMRFFIRNPPPVADNISLQALKYMASRPEGSHTAIFTHDDYLSSLLHSLGLISSESDPSALAIYPLETILFAFSDQHVAITRMRLEVWEDGFIPGKFETYVLWKGTREEWDKKVEEVTTRAQNWDISTQARDCLNALQVCEAEPLEVVY